LQITITNDIAIIFPLVRE